MHSKLPQEYSFWKPEYLVTIAYLQQCKQTMCPFFIPCQTLALLLSEKDPAMTHKTIQNFLESHILQFFHNKS